MFNSISFFFIPLSSLVDQCGYVSHGFAAAIIINYELIYSRSSVCVLSVKQITYLRFSSESRRAAKRRQCTISHGSLKLLQHVMLIEFRLSADFRASMNRWLLELIVEHDDVLYFHLLMVAEA